MENIIDRIRNGNHHNVARSSLRRSRSVRASLRLIGSRWRITKDPEETESLHPEDIDDGKYENGFDKSKRNSIAFSSHHWNGKSHVKNNCDIIYRGAEGKFLVKTPIMTKRKHEATKPKSKSGDIDLILKPQNDKVIKMEKGNKLADLFSGKGRNKDKEPATFHDDIPKTVPPKAAALLQIPNSNKKENFEITNGKMKDKISIKKKMTLKNVGKSESLSNMKNEVVTAYINRGLKKEIDARRSTEKRVRRGSEGDTFLSCGSCGGGNINPAFVFSTPPKERKGSPATYTKLPYGALLEGCAGAAGAGGVRRLAPAKPQHDKEEKRSHVNIHLQALFAAVEHGHVDKARTILESTDVEVNSLNADGVSPLDVAVLSNHRALAHVLLEHGAREGTHFRSAECLSAHLRRLARDADARLHELAGGGHGGPALPGDDVVRSGCTRSAAPSTAAGTTGCAGGPGAERDKQIQHWDRRSRALKRMMLGLQQSRLPLPPLAPELDVCGAHAVTVRLRDSHDYGDKDEDGEAPIVTKYRVQWSSRSDFSNVCGSREAGAGRTNGPSSMCGPGLAGAGLRVTASGLTRGRRYFFRAQAGNLKGWGSFTNSKPRSVVPSSWRDVDGRSSRYDGGVGGVGGTSVVLDALGVAARAARRPPARAGDIGGDAHTGEEQRRPTKKKTTGTIRQLFTAASKFQKNLRRGVYLACILYHEDKVLVTNEDFLPVIEVDDTYPTGVYTDFHWFMKIGCSWEDVKSLRQDMEKHSSSSIHFRLKLLTAAAQMQSALCIQDLGQMYHKPLRDSHGTLVVSCVQGVKSAKSVSVLNARWLPLTRLRRRVTALSDDNTMGELLMASIHEQIAYHQASSVQLSRGLYLGYLKLQSCVEVVRVVVPAKSPNAPPHTRVRDNPHVSAEEWEFLKRQQNDSSSANNEDTISMRRMSITSLQQRAPTESQQMFLDQITNAAKRLLKYMDIPNENALTHRLYDFEVIDLNNDISFIMICPPAESACSVPGQKEILLQRGDLLSLPIQAFEMIHLQTYHNTIINKYARLSCVLELDIALANHLHREAFSTAEVQAAKERLSKLEELQTNLNTVWKAARWLMDLISFARDKDKGSNNAGISIKNIVQRNPMTAPANKNIENGVNNKQVSKSRNANSQVDFLQLPPRDTKIMKSSPGRGSWPGPAASGSANGATNLLHPELSKSEQHLSVAPRDSSMSTLSGSQYLSATSGVDSDLDNYSRKGSDASQFTHSSVVSQNYLGSNSQFQTKSANSMQSVSKARLPSSRSEDTLLITQANADNARRRTNILNASLSATSSPLLYAKPFYAGSMISVRTANTTTTSDSMHSLSSDSESQSCPITTSTPTKPHPKLKQQRCHNNIGPSKSMTNMKTTEFTDTGQSNVFLKPTTYLKPTLNAIQSENEGSGGSEKADREVEGEVGKPGKSEHIDSAASTEKIDVINQEPGILQVFAAYDTGLATGTSLKLHVTPRTSAREVIDLVVKQLNVAAALKGRGGPSATYSSERLQDFCLVAVIGARERCLRDDFRPLALQNPWRKGRLYVRLRHDVLAALQHSSKQPTYI